MLPFLCDYHKVGTAHHHVQHCRHSNPPLILLLPTALFLVTLCPSIHKPAIQGHTGESCYLYVHTNVLDKLQGHHGHTASHCYHQHMSDLKSTNIYLQFHMLFFCEKIFHTNCRFITQIFLLFFFLVKVNT